MLEEISTITAKGRTTIPKSVRQALGVDYDGKITFRIDEHGVSVHLADAGHDDPAIDSFPSFLAEDIKRRPEALTEGVKVDLDALIDNEKRSAKSRYASIRSDWRTWRECL